MPLNPPFIVNDPDVYILTFKGSNELQALQTGLAALSLKLLVLIDGRTTVAEIRQRANPVPTGAQFSAVMQELISGGYVDLNTNQLTQLFDFIEFFRETPKQPSASVLDQVQSEAASGTPPCSSTGIRYASPCDRPTRPSRKVASQCGSLRTMRRCRNFCGSILSLKASSPRQQRTVIKSSPGSGASLLLIWFCWTSCCPTRMVSISC